MKIPLSAIIGKPKMENQSFHENNHTIWTTIQSETFSRSSPHPHESYYRPAAPISQTAATLLTMPIFKVHATLLLSKGTDTSTVYTTICHTESPALIDTATHTTHGTCGFLARAYPCLTVMPTGLLAVVIFHALLSNAVGSGMQSGCLNPYKKCCFPHKDAFSLRYRN